MPGSDTDRTRVGLLMAGGAGTRLYPASREHRPKQFQSFGGDRSLLRQAADRVDFLDSLYVVTREAYAEQVRDIVPEAAVLTEPEPKDTGPALVYATHEIARLETDPVLLCLPSDHVIGDGFHEPASTALDVASETDRLVTLGIDPTRAATGYGYILPGESAGAYAPVETFHEKPDRETAEGLIEDGAKWNAGIFAWEPSVFLQAARESPLESLVDALDADEAEAGFDRIEPTSVDNAVLERASNVAVVPASVPWDDLGSWDALERVLSGENAIIGEALPIDSSGNVVASDDKHVSLVGVEDLVVAAYDDRVLVVPKDRAQEVRSVVAALREWDAF